MPDGYVVQCSDGPAAGWEYWTAIPPGERIIVKASPFAHAMWMRMPSDMVDGTTPLHFYKRQPLDAYTEKDVSGSLLISYNVTEDGT